MKVPIQLDPSHHEYTRTAVITIEILSDGLCDIHPNITREEPTAADLTQIISTLPQALSPSLAEVAKPLFPPHRHNIGYPHPTTTSVENQIIRDLGFDPHAANPFLTAQILRAIRHKTINQMGHQS
jgi:hypothetical protein